MEYKELLNNANVGVKKVVDYINENKDLFDGMNLKLHDAFYYVCTDMEKDFPLCYEENYDYFSQFCKDSYDIFLEWCDENDIDFYEMRHQLGRTSVFYLNKWYNENIDYMLYDIIYDLAEWWYSDYFNLYNGIVSVDEDMDIEDCVEVLNYLSDNFYNDFMDAIVDIKKVYDYIVDFKENQVDYFKDYLVGNEDYLIREKNKKEKAIADARQKCIDIQRKYGILDYEMETLKENILHF